jgi:hypothetical protein
LGISFLYIEKIRLLFTGVISKKAQVNGLGFPLGGNRYTF